MEKVQSRGNDLAHKRSHSSYPLQWFSMTKEEEFKELIAIYWLIDLVQWAPMRAIVLGH